MTRITIKTDAYSRNRHYNELSEELLAAGFQAGTNVAIDGEVSIDTDAPRATVEAMTDGRPKTVRIT